MARRAAAAHASCGLVFALVVLGLTGCHKQEQTPAQKAVATKAEAAVGTARNVSDTIGSASEFRKFTKLVKFAGLEKAFGGVGNYTVFAPTDAAMAKLPAELTKTLESKEGRPQLLAMLRQHIVTGHITPADLERALAKNGGAVSVATMGGSPIRLHRQGTIILLGAGDGGPKIAGPSIAARNGQVYPIDQVLQPPTKAGDAR